MQLFRKLVRRWHTWFAWGTVEILIHREVQLNGVTGAYRYRYLEQTPTGETRSPWHYGRPPGWRPRAAILDMADSLKEAWAENAERAQEIREDAEARRKRLRAAIEGPGSTFKLKDHDDVRRMAERLAPLHPPEPRFLVSVPPPNRGTRTAAD